MRALALARRALTNWFRNFRTGISACETELVLHHDWGFTVTPNLFVALVSPSAQKKSPIIKAMVTDPLRRRQKKAKKEHKQAFASDASQIKDNSSTQVFI